MKIEGIESLKKKMASLAAKHGREPKVTVVVGVTQRYSLKVHEDLKAYHPVGQAKYLEQPARELGNSGEFGRVVEMVVKAGEPMSLGLTVAGENLKRDMQDNYVPVDTTALKVSAFVCKEEELEAVSAAKFAESEAIRLMEMAARAGAAGGGKK